MGLGWLEQPTLRLSGVRSNQTELQALRDMHGLKLERADQISP
jgi:hypothetical protein